MDIVFMGTPDFAAQILETIWEKHRVLAVVTQPDRPRDRGKKNQPCPVKALAESKGLTVFSPERVRDKGFFEELSKIPAQVYVVVAYGQILPQRILDLPKYGALNIHASLLPKYRGAAPIQWVVINGETETGVTIMKMDKGMDTGDMLLRKSINIEPDESAETLGQRLCNLGGQAILEALDNLENLVPVAQNHDEASHAPILTKELGRINWNQSARAIHNLVRGVIPWPGAFTEVNGETLKIWKAGVVEDCAFDFEKAEPGQVIGDSKEGLFVKCGDGVLVIKELQAQGKKSMAAKDYLRGKPIKAGTVLK